ncbi:diphosphomevalonate decarboxylase [Brevibacterium sp. 50QC2O2]|uniref:diphosphomevalonate decarboxylase n=1 Tax=Brevibacterium TaxID=1696 RepID=UPI00211CFC16|nr:MULTISPECIES: diphosphomevalonate decarboxylase [unclassified Brevibacterium]MCQ9385619.1 diphosphomevalonate decarboxylase [Brevibacterium sp. 68QC2CO]MCQ9389871.1 diphosphomevalonate decarboxylase [Brevibacterium sp. 50QC2O2]
MTSTTTAAGHAVPGDSAAEKAAPGDVAPEKAAPGDATPGHAIARAHPNIALIKYWGKRDEAWMLPVAGSMSLTLDGFATTTEVTLADAVPTAAVPDGTSSSPADTFELGGAPADAKATARVTAFLDVVRALAAEAGLPTAGRAARVRSHNEAPTGAGLASSAAGFAALATAASAAYGLELDSAALSRLARRGSGSASRSIIPGTAIWHAGEGMGRAADAGCFAEALAAPDMRLVIVTVDGRTKAVSSRTAMRATAATSPFYPAWITSTEQSLQDMQAACAAGDFERIGALTETHAMRMHALIQSCEPPIRYLQPASIALFDECARLRAAGLQAWGTADAGPNVAILTTPEDAAAVAEAATAVIGDAGAVRVVGPGPGAALVDATTLEEALAAVGTAGAGSAGAAASDAGTSAQTTIAQATAEGTK